MAIIDFTIAIKDWYSILDLYKIINGYVFT